MRLEVPATRARRRDSVGGISVRPDVVAPHGTRPIASKKRRAEMTTLLKCLACGEIQELADGRTVCKCGRSAARLDGAIVEVQGPARVLVPADDVMTVEDRKSVV